MIYKSFDIETTGFSPYKGDSIFAYCIGHEDGKVDVYRFDKGLSERVLAEKVLRTFFNNTNIAKVCHNYKFELQFLLVNLQLHIPRETEWHDTMLMSQLVRNLAPSHTLDYLCWELCGYSRDLDHKVKRLGKALGGYQNIPEYIMDPYQKADGERTMLLFQCWHNEIVSNPKLYKDYLTEIELVKVTQREESFGIQFAEKEAAVLYEWLQNQLEEITEDAYELLGERININSDDQLRRILYKKYNYPITKLTKKAKKPAVDKLVLMDLRDKYPNPIFDYILKYKSYDKGLSMIESYREEAVGKNNIIHANINTNQARTGRESITKPALQTISKEEVLLNPFPVPARRCFKARSGRVLLFGDYSGIEMRLIIEVTQEKRWLDLLQEGGDVHGEVAEWYFGQGYAKVQRDAAKNSSFAKAYGAGLGNIARVLGLSVEQAKPGYDLYCRNVPRIASFTSDIVYLVEKQGYVETVFGRKLYIQLDKPYIGANYLIQGTAAGIIKRAQVNVDEYLKVKWNDEIKLVIPVHDELIISFPRNLLRNLKPILREISEYMTDIPEITVPLEVEWKMSTTTWAKAEEIVL